MKHCCNSLSFPLALTLVLAACQANPMATPQAAEAAPATSNALLAKPVAAEGWDVAIALDLGATGVWTTRVLDVFDCYGGNEVVALDDLGRCHVIVQYAGKWTDLVACSDGTWLGGLTLGDLDPRKPGRELYVGAESGRVYQITPQPEGILDCNLIADLAGAEVHTLIACEGELVAFTSPGSIWRLAAPKDGTRFEAREIATTRGRVRDVVQLADGRLALVSRDGSLEIRPVDALGSAGELVLQVESGLGRVAVSRAGVLYSASDDGVVWRSERTAQGWRNERIHVGPQGLRGIVCGSFGTPGASEEVALFGYSANVEVLARDANSKWSARTLFTDRDRGHWLGVGELDQRNDTDELVGSGYGGRVFVLTKRARQP